MGPGKQVARSSSTLCQKGSQVLDTESEQWTFIQCCKRNENLYLKGVSTLL